MFVTIERSVYEYQGQQLSWALFKFIRQLFIVSIQVFDNNIDIEQALIDVPSELISAGIQERWEVGR